MRTVRPIREEELDSFVTISANAYPGIEVVTQADRNRFRDRLLQAIENPRVHLYALFEEGEMHGVMRLYDFTMKLLSTKTVVGGVGGVAVDLLHKKEKIAADMLRAYLEHYRQNGSCLAALYPFRPDFYKRMGFGYGTKMNSYRFRPDSLPKGSSKQHVYTLTSQDKNALCACYDRLLGRSNGLMERFDDTWDTILAEPTMHVMGVKRSDHLSGYMIFKFIKGENDHFLSNDIHIYELIYDKTEDLFELLTFLRSQADQIEQIIINTQDEDFHHLLQDPRYGSGQLLPMVSYHESNTQGLGIMYRVIDLPQLFKTLENHNFGDVTCRLKIELIDTFLPQNAGSTVVNFVDGRARLVNEDEYDVAIKLDVSDFSSLIVGAVGFAKLYEFGLALIADDNYLGVIERLFKAPKPICMTRF